MIEDAKQTAEAIVPLLPGGQGELARKPSPRPFHAWLWMRLGISLIFILGRRRGIWVGPLIEPQS